MSAACYFCAMVNSPLDILSWNRKGVHFLWYMELLCDMVFYLETGSHLSSILFSIFMWELVASWWKTRTHVKLI